METGNENSNSSGLDALHELALDAANGTDAGSENGNAPEAGAPAPEDRARAFAKATLSTLAKVVSESVSGHFLGELQKITSYERAQRIAARTALSEWQQTTFVESGADLAEKYGMTNVIGPELALLAVVVGYGSNIMAARKDLAELMAAVKKQEQPKQ